MILTRKSKDREQATFFSDKCVGRTAQEGDYIEFETNDIKKLVMSPAYFGDELCEFGSKCPHEVDCNERRLQMAVMAYLKKDGSYRDLQRRWGISRATIQRRSQQYKGRMSIHLLIDPLPGESYVGRGATKKRRKSRKN